MVGTCSEIIGEVLSHGVLSLTIFKKGLFHLPLTMAINDINPTSSNSKPTYLAILGTPKIAGNSPNQAAGVPSFMTHVVAGAGKTLACSYASQRAFLSFSKI